MSSTLLFFDVLLVVSFCQLFGLISCTDDYGGEILSFGRHATFQLDGEFPFKQTP